MHIETERKFLVKDDSYKAQAVESHRLRQGYIAHDGGRTVRVRLWDEQGILTIKGPSMDGGMSRLEWEKEITLQEAEDLFLLCKPGMVDKTRWIVPAQMPGQAGHDEENVVGYDEEKRTGHDEEKVVGHDEEKVAGYDEEKQAGHDVMADPDRPARVFEVDEFYGENEGLVMAEIELDSPDEPFERPSWLGEEVTGDKRYYNSYLARNPFRNW